MLYPLRITVNRATALSQFFGTREYLLVIGHAFGQHEPCWVSLPVFEVLEVAAPDGGPDTPQRRGLVYLELFGDSFVRRVVLAPSVDHVLYGLYGFANGLRHGRLHALGYQARNEITDAGVVGECGNDAAVLVPLARSLVKDGVGLD